MIKLVAVVLILASLDQAKSALRTDCVEPGTDNGASYRGDVAVTESGIVCQRWDSRIGNSGTPYPESYPDAGLDENYCRNFDDSDGPWCYTHEGTNMWELCDSPICSASCSKPVIENGMVSPDRLAIESGGTYSVTCDATFEISGSPTINCGQGNQLSELPTCEPVSENDGNDNGETDGNDNGETENTNKNDYSGAGYTNISTILFGTLMCKIVMIY